MIIVARGLKKTRDRCIIISVILFQKPEDSVMRYWFVYVFAFSKIDFLCKECVLLFLTEQRVAIPYLFRLKSMIV